MKIYILVRFIDSFDKYRIVKTSCYISSCVFVGRVPRLSERYWCEECLLYIYIFLFYVLVFEVMVKTEEILLCDTAK